MVLKLTIDNVPVEFTAEHKLFEGLYLATDNKAVQTNMDRLAILAPSSNLDTYEVIAKHGSYATVTLLKSGHNYMQYLITAALEDGKVEGMSPQEIEGNTRDLILRARRMIIEGEL